MWAKFRLLMKKFNSLIIPLGICLDNNNEKIIKNKLKDSYYFYNGNKKSNFPANETSSTYFLGKPVFVLFIHLVIQQYLQYYYDKTIKPIVGITQ